MSRTPLIGIKNQASQKRRKSANKAKISLYVRLAEASHQLHDLAVRMDERFQLDPNRHQTAPSGGGPSANPDSRIDRSDDQEYPTVRQEDLEVLDTMKEYVAEMMQILRELSGPGVRPAGNAKGPGSGSSFSR